MACVSVKKPQGIHSLKFDWEFSAVLQLFLQAVHSIAQVLLGPFMCYWDKLASYV